MKTNRQVQRFKAKNRKALAQRYAKARVRVQDFTLAAANAIRNQPLDVSAVEVLDHEIESDN